MEEFDAILRAVDAAVSGKVGVAGAPLWYTIKHAPVPDRVRLGYNGYDVAVFDRAVGVWVVLDSSHWPEINKVRVAFRERLEASGYVVRVEGYCASLYRVQSVGFTAALAEKLLGDM